MPKRSQRLFCYLLPSARWYLRGLVFYPVSHFASKLGASEHLPTDAGCPDQLPVHVARSPQRCSPGRLCPRLVPASPQGYCPWVQTSHPDGDLRESGPQPLGLDATKKRTIKQNVWKSVSYLLYCQAAVRLAGITIPEKQSGKDFSGDIVGSGRDLAACCGLGQVGTGMGLGFLLACEGKENV